MRSNYTQKHRLSYEQAIKQYGCPNFKGEDAALKFNIYVACLALAQSPYNCHPRFRKAIAYWYVFLDIFNDPTKPTHFQPYIISNLTSPMRVYHTICTAIGLLE